MRFAPIPLTLKSEEDRLAKIKEAESNNKVVLDYEPRKRNCNLEPMGLSCNRIGQRASSSGFRGRATCAN